MLDDSDKMFDAYVHVNELFADAVLEQYQSGDIVWVQDYHLMLLPTLLRAKVPSIKIGFFLHTPFPSYDFFRISPHSESLLNGVLAR